MLTVSQAAEMLGVTTKTVRVWGKEGKLTVYRTAGGHRRLAVKDIEEFLNKGKERQKDENNICSR